MCGIAGIIELNGENRTGLMEEMMQILQHRGPDGYKITHSDGVTLGHRRLSIIDLESGDQPMLTDDGRYVIVYNGEIYNYKALQVQLESEGVAFHTRSDTEVLLKGYQLWGMEVLQKLNGIFALAIHDKKTGRLFLARDHFGIKPLYYYWGKDFFLFGSEQKALLLHPGVERKPNYRAMHIQMNLRYTQSNETLFEGFRKLPHGHYMIYDKGKLTLERYFKRAPVVDYNMTEKTAIEGMHHYISQAVRRQLVSDVPVGVYLSGGLDSSTIVEKMAAAGVPEINSFTMGFNEPTDEFDDAQLVAETFKTVHHQTSLSFDPLKGYPEVLWHAEQPKINLLQGFNMSRYVSAHVKVILGGLGGDELFAGYDIHRLIYPFNTWHKYVPNTVSKLMQGLSGLLYNIQSATGPLKWDEYRRGAQMLLSIGDARRYYLILRNVWEMDAGMYSKIYTRSFIEEHDLRNVVLQEFESYFKDYKDMEALDQIMAVEMNTKMINDYLLVEDRMSMANGVEERVPFLDVDLVRFASSIPLHLKMKGGKTKYLFRKAMAGHLPPRIIKKKKWGFTVNPYLQFKKDLKEVAGRVLTEEFVHSQGIFNYEYIRKILEAKAHPRMRWHYNLLWIMTGYAIWQKMFLDTNNFKENRFSLDEYMEL